MRRLFFAAMPLALALTVAACSGGDGDNNESANDEATTAADQATPVAGANEPTPVPDKPIPSPTPVPDDVPVLQVVAGGTNFSPMRSQFAALPKTKISSGGKDYEGVTLAALATETGAPESAVATIQGTRTDNLRFGAIRFPLSEVGANTVFILDEQGRILLASTSIPADQWLKDITGIAFN